MAKFKVKKQLKNKKTGEPIKVGTVIDRLVKEVDEFEKVHGKDYLERVKEDEGDD